jgi:hypothetical protein
MAFRGKLQLADSEYDVLSCYHSFHRDVDEKGRPVTNVYGGTVRIVVESNDDTNIIVRLMDQFKPLSGSVIFHKSGEPSAMKELSWENGYIMKFHETFDSTGKEPMKIYFEISAEKITMGSETIDHKWQK